ncbi:hypothetical protein BHM03_00055725 [Ensete ventricosum]|nr:hypothetical protein BHM03_00055725 [Ensete ventricosum]
MISEPRLFVQKIGFKLCIMRLNRVELFYAFLLYFRSEGSEEGGIHLRAGPLQGRPLTTKPAIGATVRLRQGLPTRGIHPRAWLSPIGAAHVGIGRAHRGTTCRHGSRPPTRGVPKNNGTCCRSNCPWAVRQLAMCNVAAYAGAVATDGRGKGLGFSSTTKG